MAANVTEVTGYKSIDGQVFDTYLKANRRNIVCLCHELFDVDPAQEDPDKPENSRAAMLLYYRLTQDEGAKTFLTQLASELS